MCLWLPAQSKESGIQKKAYRVLEEMCGGEREPCKRFVLANLEQLKVVLLDSLKSASSPAKRVRALWGHRCLNFHLDVPEPHTFTLL